MDERGRQRRSKGHFSQPHCRREVHYTVQSTEGEVRHQNDEHMAREHGPGQVHLRGHRDRDLPAAAVGERKIRKWYARIAVVRGSRMWKWSSRLHLIWRGSRRKGNRFAQKKDLGFVSRKHSLRST